MQTHRCLTSAEVAKMVRAKLAERFPDVRFSVRCYHGGRGGEDTVHVRWAEGPSWLEVNRFVDVFRTRDETAERFDLRGRRFHWLLPTGEVVWRREPLLPQLGERIALPAQITCGRHTLDGRIQFDHSGPRGPQDEPTSRPRLVGRKPGPDDLLPF